MYMTDVIRLMESYKGDPRSEHAAEYLKLYEDKYITLVNEYSDLKELHKLFCTDAQKRIDGLLAEIHQLRDDRNISSREKAADIAIKTADRLSSEARRIIREDARRKRESRKSQNTVAERRNFAPVKRGNEMPVYLL